ncbi:MAG: type pilus biosis ATPase PilM [Verrucomicrobiota bacterium]|jgi:type IV pilus assembly protein PilM
MALPFINRSTRRDQIVAIDMGGRTTKAVLMQRRGETLVLAKYAMVDAPAPQKTFSAELMGEHLKSIVETLGAKTKSVTLCVGVNDVFVRQAELPQLPIQDMRLVLKTSPKTYLQQDYPNHIFDCYILPTNATLKPDEKGKPVMQKFKVLVAAAKKQFVEDMKAALDKAELKADGIVPGIIGPINSFEAAHTELFSKSLVALVDIGFKSSTICILQNGELVLSRVVNLGGDKITGGLAENMAISYAEAEGIKMGMPSEVQPVLEALVSPLGRELRASVDFFEHQQEKQVTHIFVSGGSSRSEFIVKILEAELMMPCQTWNPGAAFQLALAPEQMAEAEQIVPQLAVATGAAIAEF